MRRTALLLLVLTLALVTAAAPPAAAQLPGGAEPYHNYATLREDTRALAEAHPDIARFRVVGTSILGLDIFAVDVANMSNPQWGSQPAMYVDGGHHGNEMLSIEAAYLFLKDVLEAAAEDPSILEGKRLTVTPVVNPDGYVRDFRTNTNGVDLNRNYPFHWGLYGTSGTPGGLNYRGSAPASEPETRHNMALMEEMDLRVYLSGHTGTYDFVLPWRASEDGEIPDWPVYEAYLTAVEEATGMEYRDPSGAGESIAWGYGNRTALSLVVEVSTEQFNPGSAEDVEARLEEPLKTYHLAWDNLLDWGGHLVASGAADGQRVVTNVGVGPAYNVTMGAVTVPRLDPGRVLTVPADVVEVQYRRVAVAGDDPALATTTLTVGGVADVGGAADGGLDAPAPPVAAVAALLGAMAVLLRRRGLRPQ